MSTGPNRTWDVLLESSDDANPTTSQGLMLASELVGRAPDGSPLYKKRWREFRRPPVYFNPRTNGPVTQANKDPAHDLVWSQKDWSGGGLQAEWDDEDKYALCDGLDPRPPGVLTIGPKLNGPMDFLVQNGGAELGTTTGWSVVNVGTLTAVTTDTPRSGTYQFKLTSGAAGGSPTSVRQRLGQTNGTALEIQHGNPEVYQGTSITAYMYAKRGSAGTASVRVNIADDVATTNGTAVVLTTSFQLVQATRTVNASATTLRWEWEITAITGGATIFFDDFIVIPAGGITPQKFVFGQEELIYNGGAEINTITAWTLSNGGNLSSDSTTPYSGSRSWRITSSAATESAYQSLTSPTTYQGKTVVFTAYTRRGAVADNARLFISDDAGTTNSAANTSATFTSVTVSRVISSTATFVRLGIEKVDSGGGGAFAYYDHLRAYTTTRVDGSPLYGIFGRVVARWDETNDIWNAVYIHASVTATDLIEYNQVVYVAFGNGDNSYIVGTGTGWFPSVIAGDAKYAHFFRTSRETLWKSRFDGNGQHTYIASSTNPDQGGSWGSEYTVGSLGFAITGLYDINDSIVVGKEDGLHLYNRVVNDFFAADTFVNVTQEYKIRPSADNFARGVESKGWLYLSAAQQTFFRYNGRVLEDITLSHFLAPRIKDVSNASQFGGKIRGMTSDATGLYVLMDTPTSDTTVTKQTWLMSCVDAKPELRREGTPGVFHAVHTLALVSIGDILFLGSSGLFLWALGRIYDSTIVDYVPAIYRWSLPDKSRVMAFDAAPVLGTTGALHTSWIDFNLPTDDKALVALTSFHRDNLDTNHTIALAFRKDWSGGAFTTVNTLNTSGTPKTIFFDTITTPETTAVARSIQLRITLTSNDTVSPELYGLALQSTLRPDRVRMWELYFLVTPDALSNAGLVLPERKQTVVAALKTLEAQDYPIRMTASFGAETDVPEENKISCHIVPGSLERVGESDQYLGTEIWHVLVQEVVTA